MSIYDTLYDPANDPVNRPLHRRITQLATLIVFLVITTLALTGCTLLNTDAPAKAKQAGQRIEHATPAEPQPESSEHLTTDARVEHISTVTRIIDGDTLAVGITDALPANGNNPEEHIVRLLGIDTPEMNFGKGVPECGAEEAARWLSLMAEGRTVAVIHDSTTDKSNQYGRTLAYVEVINGDESIPYSPLTGEMLPVDGLGQSQIIMGFASAWYPDSAPKPSNFDTYVLEQRVAQDAGIGLWGSCSTVGR